MISGGLNGGYAQETIEMSFVGNALLYMLDIALCFGGIVNLVPLFAMGPVGIAIGIGLIILASVAINAAFNALAENFQMMDAYIRGEINGDEIVDGFVWNAVLTVTALGLAQCIDLGIEIAKTHAEQYLKGVVGPSLTEKLLSEGMPSSQVAKAVKQIKTLGYTDEVIGLWRDYAGNGDDFLKLVDEFGDEFVEAFRKNGDEAVDEFRELLGVGLETGGLIKEGLGKISGNKYTVTQRGIDNIKNYLAEQGFIDDYENRAMLERIENALENGEKITGADAVFYTHELKEAQLVASGVEQSVAHKMALEYYEVSPYSVYHPDVIKMEPEWWNNAWFEFWEIER